MEGRTHSGLGSKTAALWPWDRKPSSAPLFRGLQREWGRQSPPHSRQAGGLSPHVEMRDTYSYPRAIPPSHAISSQGLRHGKGGQETPVPAKKSLTCYSWTCTQRREELAPFPGSHAPEGT